MLKVSGGVKRKVLVLKFLDDVSVCRNTFYIYCKQATPKASNWKCCFQTHLRTSGRIPFRIFK